MLQEVQELPRHLAEVRLMADAVAVRDRDPQPFALVRDAEAWVIPVQTRHAIPQRRRHAVAFGGFVGHDVQFRAEVLFLALPHLDARTGAAEDRQVRVAAARGRLVIPQDVQLHLDAAQPITDRRVAEVIELAVARIRSQIIWEVAFTRYAPEVFATQRGRPAAALLHLEVAA